MNPRIANRRRDDIPPIVWPRTNDSGEAPLSDEDLIGDLDPGWLGWRAAQADR